MLRFFKNKLFLLFLATLVILIIVGISSSQGSRINYIGNVVRVPLSPFQKFFNYIGQKADGGLTYFKDIKLLRQENEELKTRIDELEKSNRDLMRYSQENEVLRDTLKLKDQFKNYDYIGGNIIAKDAGNWFNIFTIDVGTNDHISVNSSVITSKGLVGKISETGPFTSKVLSLIDTDNTVFAVNSRTMELVRVRGDIKLKDLGLCRLDYSEKDIEVGDEIETSGIGGIYPKGILIGKVIEVRGEENQFDRYAIIEPAVNFKKLQDVFVLSAKKNNKSGKVSGGK